MGGNPKSSYYVRDFWIGVCASLARGIYREFGGGFLPWEARVRGCDKDGKLGLKGCGV